MFVLLFYSLFSFFVFLWGFWGQVSLTSSYLGSGQMTLDLPCLLFRFVLHVLFCFCFVLYLLVLFVLFLFLFGLCFMLCFQHVNNILFPTNLVFLRSVCWLKGWHSIWFRFLPFVMFCFLFHEDGVFSICVVFVQQDWIVCLFVWILFLFLVLGSFFVFP